MYYNLRNQFHSLRETQTYARLARMKIKQPSLLFSTSCYRLSISSTSRLKSHDCMNDHDQEKVVMHVIWEMLWVSISVRKSIGDMRSLTRAARWTQTSLLFQPKLLVRLAVEALCWSTNRRLANSFCNSSGITLTWGGRGWQLKLHYTNTQTLHSLFKLQVLCNLLWPLDFLCVPDIPILQLPD